ncbi:putative hydrolase [Bradyrhizobium sp. STM 3843]|uniref:hydrolase n=1 Tax=Bradyrhizobium sp. STM 3843 TaxID=551947 RepID=UPI0002403CC2|nr:hydrolase [Bradyrhizobium sp. STM 3843]CCE08493.1 putative hydrolase [Bradyrhizobium sp. STM 3843]
MIKLDPKTTALVLIDLQNGIVGLPLAPRTGPDVAQRSREIAGRFRVAGSPVVLVNVGFAADFGDALSQPVDQPMGRPEGSLPHNWSSLVDGLKEAGDLTITKRQWGAFYGTELDLQLQRRGVKTIVLGGIATNFGVESTARQAWEHGYAVVIPEDLCTSVSEELHQMAVRNIFPRISRVTRSDDLAFAA